MKLDVKKQLKYIEADYEQLMENFNSLDWYQQRELIIRMKLTLEDLIAPAQKNGEWHKDIQNPAVRYRFLADKFKDTWPWNMVLSEAADIIKNLSEQVKNLTECNKILFNKINKSENIDSSSNYS
jgi:hypothetical protein